MADINLYSYNAKGLETFEKRCEVFHWLQELKYDVICIQESHSPKKKFKNWIREWGAKICFSHGSSNARGVMTCFSKNLEFKIHDQKKDKFGRILVLDVTIKGLRMSLANIYAPNDDIPEFFIEVFEKIMEFNNHVIVIGGDFNLVMNVSKDKKGGRPRTHENSKNLIQNYMKENDLVDIWRHQHPDIFRYTWKSYRTPFIYERLDFFLTSFSMISSIAASEIFPGYRSDHRLVYIKVKIDQEKRGNGFWKLNTSLLDIKEYGDAIRRDIRLCKIDDKDKSDGLMLWEVMKCRIRGVSIKFSAKMKREKREWKKCMEKYLAQLENELPLVDNADVRENIISDISSIKREQEILLRQESIGARVRSRTQYYEEGEKSSKYFHSLEKRNQQNKHVKVLENDKGEDITGIKNILQEEVKFYQALYESKIDKESQLMDIYNDFFNNEKRLDDIEICDLPEKIDEVELKKVVDSFANDKSPGSDGLPIEFDKCFWDDIKPYLIDSYYEIYKSGTLGITQKQGVITLIPKKDKNPKHLKNWRPITLLNTDYKILTKYLASYLKRISRKNHPSQSKGFLTE